MFVMNTGQTATDFEDVHHLLEEFVARVQVLVLLVECG